jgi:hypothetical protein
METYSMSQKEINQISVFEGLNNREIKHKEAAMILGLTTRQTKRKLKAFRRLGPKGLIHLSRGKPSNNQLDPRIKQRAIYLIENKYPDFAPTFASEKLEEIHKLSINRETLRLAMIECGLWQVHQRKPTHRQWRERKDCFGELIQLDGSDHDWFEGRAPRCTLLAFIDDATSQITHLDFAGETTIGVMGATKRYVGKHGIPHELYADRGKVFKVNLNNEEEDKVTQYRRAIEELGSGLTYARSPQAKGRVERLFGTLQDRLVKELRLRGISTIVEANEFIEKEYLSRHNEKYAVEPKSNTNLHREATGYNLDNILCLKETRIMTCDFTLRHNNQWYQLEKKQKTLVFPKNEITIKTHLDQTVHLSIRNTNLCFHKIDKPVKSSRVKAIIEVGRKPWIPPVDHPWRKHNIFKKAEVSTLLALTKR